MPKYVKEDLITKYAKACAAKNKIDREECKPLNKQIRAKLDEGFELPTSGPFIIIKQPVGGKQLDWKVEYEKLLVKAFIKRFACSPIEALAKAQNKMEIMLKEAPDKTGFKLVPKGNPEYEEESEVA